MRQERIYHVRVTRYRVDVYHMDWTATRLDNGGLTVEWTVRDAGGELRSLSHTYAAGVWLESWSSIA